MLLELPGGNTVNTSAILACKHITKASGDVRLIIHLMNDTGVEVTLTEAQHQQFKNITKIQNLGTHVKRM